MKFNSVIKQFFSLKMCIEIFVCMNCISNVFLYKFINQTKKKEVIEPYWECNKVEAKKKKKSLFTKIMEYSKPHSK